MADSGAMTNPAPGQAPGEIVACRVCDGSGRVGEDMCPACGGTGRILVPAIAPGEPQRRAQPRPR